ncbi:MAG: GNAT family N-acetyltransferase [Asgard group archaeon]|nr:GNAT family N-acetyltransferase [Asgard group archaeon]
MQKIESNFGDFVLKIRKATLKDFDRINELTGISYGFDAEAMKERFFKRFEFIFEEYYCYEVDGNIVANMRFIPFDQYVRGKKMKMGGIAMVVSDPLYRRKGYVREIMNHLMKKMADEKYAVSCLYPFKDTFYASFNYVNANPFVRMKFKPELFSRWKKLPDGYSIKRLNHSDGYKYLKEIHGKKIPQIHGGVERSEKRWREYEEGRGNFIVAFNSKGKAEGIMKFFSKGFSAGFDWSEEGKLSVSGILYLTPKARLALYNYLYMYSDQIVEITLPIYTNESEMYSWFQGYYMVKLDPVNIWQARIINVKETLEGMEVPLDGQVSFSVSDELCSNNNQTYQITATNSKLTVKESGKEKVDMEFSIEGLTALVYGLLPTDEIEVFNWLKGASNKDKQLLDKWFPVIAPILTEGF